MSKCNLSHIFVQSNLGKVTDYESFFSGLAERQSGAGTSKTRSRFSSEHDRANAKSSYTWKLVSNR